MRLQPSAGAGDTSVFKILIAAIVVGTWNGNWFPSGRAKHRAPRDVEASRIFRASKMLAEGIAKLDPEGTNDVILCLNEMRGPAAVSNLVAGIGRKGLRPVIVTRYRWRDRFDEQQDAIATTLPVAESRWSVWRKIRDTRPPRGYAFAALVVEPAVTANVYAVHLKSNYGQGKDEEKIAGNIEKRALAIEQIVAMEKPRRASARRPVILAGDLNADRRRSEFSRETIFRTLDAAGLHDAFESMPEEERYTHENRYFGTSAIDFVLYRGFGMSARPVTLSAGDVSDHRALFALLDAKADEVSPKKQQGEKRR